MYKYDDADELLEEVYGNKYKMEYAYDGMQERKYDKYTDLSTNESLRYNYDYTPWGAFSNRTMGTGNPEVFRFGTRAEECGRDNNGNIEDHLYYDYDWGTVKQYDYTYDAFNRMITSSIGGVTTTYAYNGDNLRQSKTTNGVTTSHVYDGSDIVYEKKGSDTYVYIRGLELIASKKNDGEFEYYHHDVHGSVIAKTNSNGQTDVYEYDAFGNMESTSTTDTENPFKYCGEYVDEETGFVYLRNRYYDPSIGCFTTIDPAMDGDNWYVYCANNPTSYKDPHGLKFMFNNETDATTTLSIMETLTGYTGGYKLQDLGSGNYTIIDSGTGTINGGSATARGMIAAAMDMKASVNISYFANNGDIAGNDWFDDSVTSPKQGDPVSSNIKLEVLPNIELHFTHELSHALTSGYGFYKNINFYGFDKELLATKYNDSFGTFIVGVENDHDDVIRKYYEAVAITLSNAVSSELGLGIVDSYDREYSKNGNKIEYNPHVYGRFPSEYKNIPVLRTLEWEIVSVYQNYDMYKTIYRT